VRLAINLRRLGRDAEASELLQRVIGEINPDWVLTLAYQELASMRLSGGNPQGAVNLLEQAVGRLPGQGGLQLQLAYALDRTGESARARRVLGRLEPTDGSEESGSPRYRYSKWPEAGDDAERAALEQAALVRLPVLAATVANLPSAEQLDESVQQRDDGRNPRDRRRRSGAGEDR
jgi:tetratricopeptide (TPR) repeat protein